MTCQQCRAAMLTYLDGSLSPRQRTKVEAHLATCAACRTELAQWQAIGAATAQAHTLRSPTAGAQQRGWDQLATQLVGTYAPPAKGSPMTFDSPAPTTRPDPTTAQRRRGIIPIAAMLLAVIVAALAAWRIGIAQTPPTPQPIIIISHASTAPISGNSDQTVTVYDPATGQLRWSQHFTIPYSYFNDAILAAGNRVLVVTATAPGSEALVALRASDGVVAWQIPLINPSKMLVTPTMVYLMGTTQDAQGGGSSTNVIVMALDAATGQQQWHKTLPNLSAAHLYLAGDALIVEVTANGASNQVELIGLSRSDGQRFWQRTLPDQTGDVLDYRLASIGQTIVFQDAASSSLVALDAISGKTVWTFPHCGFIIAMGNTFFVDDILGACSIISGMTPSTNTLYALRASDSAIRWQHHWSDVDLGGRGGGAILGGYILTGNQFVLLRDYNNQQVLALDPLTGATRWQTPLQDSGDSIIEQGSSICVLHPLPLSPYTTTLALTALSEQSGAVRWQKTISSGGPSALYGFQFISGTLIGLALAPPSQLIAIDAGTGAIRLQGTPPGPALSFPPSHS